jgi:prepilin-type N-terminal cleavage/methylation domain-containing protein
MHKKGFTLIELLVVVAIIGVLAAVVLSFLSSARNKGKEAAIQSNLKNMVSTAELLYSDSGSYWDICTVAEKMLEAISDAGSISGCYTHDGTRWGASGSLGPTEEQSYSADAEGVVTWDTSSISGTAMSWQAANDACGNVGKHLPSLEQAKSLFDAHGDNPLGFPDAGLGSAYWTSTAVPTDGSLAYVVRLGDTGLIVEVPKTSSRSVRCVY